jgi:hypothetical protein
MYESILETIKQEMQSAMAADPVNFPAVRKLADMALDLQASSVSSVEEVRSSSQFGTGPVALRAGYGPSGTERMISELLPQIMPLLERKFASDTLDNLSSLLETYMKLSNPNTPGHDPELAKGVKNILEKQLKEGNHEAIHTDTPGGHQPDA